MLVGMVLVGGTRGSGWIVGDSETILGLAKHRVYAHNQSVMSEICFRQLKPATQVLGSQCGWLLLRPLLVLAVLVPY